LYYLLIGGVELDTCCASYGIAEKKLKKRQQKQSMLLVRNPKGKGRKRKKGCCRLYIGSRGEESERNLLTRIFDMTREPYATVQLFNIEQQYYSFLQP